jgi:ribosomal protein L14
MIRRNTKLFVFDNSTVKLLKCLSVIKRTIGRVGDLILGVVKREFYRRRSFRKRFFFAVIMATKKRIFRKAGAYYVRFPRSGVLLLKDEKDSLFGTRFYARIPIEIRKSAFKDICQFSRKTF